MKSIVCILLLMASTALAGTHVNISFSQQHSIGSTKTTKLQNDRAELVTSDNSGKSNIDDENKHFAKIQIEGQKDKLDFENKQNVVDGDVKTKQDSTSESRSGRIQDEERDGFFNSQTHNQQRSFYNTNREVLQNHGQFRSLSPQDMKNMEFERYIQNYHSGPTVETVYESAKPEMHHTLKTSAINEGSQRVVKFERQVALPAKAESVQPSSDIIKPIVNHQTVAPSITSKSSSSSSLSPSIPNISVGSTAGNGFKVNLNPSPSSVGKDGGFNFDINYNRPNYNDPTFKYHDGHSDPHFYNQIPPSVEEPHSGYGDFYNNIYSHTQADGYHPVEQRPVVTKTIQIAQPAIKAKKYEVRHPAIQKEFYDIEERVVIKPAGTVVVELERPSAKILKEETTLPLGHPHPAVAAAYMPTRNSQSFSNIIYSNAGSSSSSNHPNNQYIPQQTYNNKNVHDHHSPTGSSTSYDQTSKEVRLESNQNKPYTGDNQFSTVPTGDAPKSQNREIVVLTDGHGNQRQLSTDQFTYSRDETDKVPSRQVYNHRSSFDYEENGRSTSQPNIPSQRSSFQPNQNSREDFSFDAEYINTSGNTNLRKDNKPARLQEQPLSERVVEQKQQTQPVIKHEHKIVLSPSQHNIYLSRNQEVPKMKFIGEAAEVREIKPYLQNHRGPIVLYAPEKSMPELKYVQRSDNKPLSRTSSQVVQYHNYPQRSQSNSATSRVQYSAPYAQMRHHSDEDVKNDQQLHKHLTSQRKSENLILEDKPTTELRKSSNENLMKNQATQAHIEIKIPNRSSEDGSKAIFVDSTTRPMMMDIDRDQTHNTKLEITVTNNGEAHQEKKEKDDHDNSEQKDSANINSNKNENITDKDSEHLSNINSKPDCGQSSNSVLSENYELPRAENNYRQQKFMRIVEKPSAASTSTASDTSSTAGSAAVQANIKPHDIDGNVQSTAGHLTPPGSRVISSTSASKESSPSESFHKRRIVVNHPFQTVREVVEHEPYTNYHEVQVSEPATPALYQSANYYETHGALRQSENRHSTSYYN